jgi:GNAT superfamily N-acetyltransferase
MDGAAMVRYEWDDAEEWKLHATRAMLENLLDMNTFRVGEETNGMGKATDRERVRTATAEDREAVRIATVDDREAIRRLVNQAFDVERFLKKGGGDRLQGDGELEALFERGTFLVKVEDGEPVGCVYVEPRGERAYLGLLSIVPARQGAGLGKQLNVAAENFAREQGCKWMDLRVVSPREEQLLPVYRKLGYAETGTEEYPAVLVEKMAIPGHFILMEKAL